MRAMAGAASPKTTIERVTHVKPVQQASSLAVKHGHLRPFQVLNSISKTWVIVVPKSKISLYLMFCSVTFQGSNQCC